MAQVVVIRPDGHDVVDVEEPISIKTMYELIDCQLVQSIDTPINGVEMISDEEGKFVAEIEFNRGATDIVKEWLAPNDFVAGTVVLCSNRGGEWIGLNTGQIATVHGELKERARQW